MTLSLPRSLIASAESLEAEKQSKIDIGGLQKSVLDTFDSIVPKPKPTVQETLAQAPPTFAPITAESIVQQPIATPTPQPEPEPFKLPEHFLQPTPEPAPTTAPLAESPIEGLAPLGARPISPAASVPAGGVQPVQRGPTSAGAPLDTSSPDAYKRSLMANASDVARRYDLPAEIIASIPIQEAGYGGSELTRRANNLFSIKGSGPAGSEHFGSVWEVIGGKDVMVPADFRKYNSTAESFEDFAKLMTETPRYANAVKTWRETRDPNAFISAVQQAGYATDPTWAGKVASIARGMPTVEAGQPAPGVAPQAVSTQPSAIPAPGASTSGAFDELTPNQFTAGKQLSYEDAMAACGPAAAIAFARRMGRNPTLDEAVGMARGVGWNPGAGMAGPASEVALLNKMGVAASMGGMDEARITRDVSTGNPVIVDTPGHYFVAERYDPASGKFDFGNSATALKASGGQRWYSLGEIGQLGMGAPRTAIFLDNPGSPTPSVAATAPPTQATPADAPAVQQLAIEREGALTQEIDQWAQLGNTFKGGTSGAQVMPAEDLTGVGDAASQGVAASAPPVRDDYARSRTEALSPQPSLGAVEPEAGTFTAPALSDEEPRDPWQRVGYALRDALGVAQSATSGASSAIAQTGDALGGAGRDLERAGRGISGAIGDVVGNTPDALGRAAAGTTIGRAVGAISDLPGTASAAQELGAAASDRVGAEFQRHGLQQDIDEYQSAIRRGDTGAALRAQQTATAKIALALPDVRNQLLDAVAQPLGLGREGALGIPSGELLKDVPGLNQIIPREARIGAADVIGNLMGGPGSPNATVDVAGSLGGAAIGDVAASIPLALWGAGQLIPIVARSVSPRLRDALEAYGRRTGNVSQTDVERIARTLDEPVPSWLNPETAGQRVTAPEITGEMPRPLGGGLLGQGPAAGIVARQADEAIPATDRYYHGTAAEFDRLRPSERGALGEGVYLTREPFNAQIWGDSAAAAKPGGSIREPAGSNIRPIDVPSDLKLLGAESDDYKVIEKMARDLGQTPNKIAAEMGYDGLRDEASSSGAIVIFGKSLDKIRNATAGTPGGIIPGGGPEARGQLLGAAGRTVGTGVAAGYEESQQEGATPQSVLGAAAGGLATGLVGEGIRAGVGGRRAGQIMARATRATDEMRDAGDPALTKLANMMDEPPPRVPEGRPVGNGIERMRQSVVRQLLNRSVTMDEIQQDIAKATKGQVPIDERISAIQRLNPSSAVDMQIQDEIMGPLRDLGNERPHVDAIMTLKQNLDQAAQKGPGRMFSGGLGARESQQALDALRTQLGPQRFAQLEQAADTFTDFNRATLDIGVQGNLIHPDLAASLNATYPNYSPTNITKYVNADGPGGVPVGKQVGLNDNGLRRLTEEGTSAAKQSPIEASVAARYDMMRRVHKNEVTGKFVEVAKQDPELSQHVQEIIPREQWIQQGRQLQPGQTLDVDRLTPDQTRIGWFDQNAVKHEYLVDDWAKPLIEGSSVGELNAYQKFLQEWRSAVTDRSLSFTMRNVPRDAYATFNTMLVRQGGPSISNVGKVVQMMAESYRDAFKGLPDGTFHGSVKDYLGAGGGYARASGRGLEEQAQLVDDIARTGGVHIKNPMDLYKWITDPLSEVNKRFELGPRGAIFQQAKKAGESDIGAVIAARDLMPYEVAGDFTKALNQSVPFLTARIAGVSSQARLAMKYPKTYLPTVLAATTGPAIAIEMYNRMDEERSKAYDDVPDYMKYLGNVIMMPWAGKDTYGMPLPNYLFLPTGPVSPFSILGHAVGAAIMGKDAKPNDFAEMFGAITEGASPVGTAGGALLSQALGPVGSTAVGLITGTDPFRGSEVATTMGDLEATRAAQGIAAGANAVLGKVPVVGPSLANVRPSQVDYAVRGVTGGPGAQILAATDLGRQRPGEASNIQDMPVVGGVVSPLIGNRTGGVLSREAGRTMASDAGEAMVESGVKWRPGPVNDRIGRVGLTRGERGEVQRDTNAIFNQNVENVRQWVPEWDTLERPAREQIFKNLYANATSTAEQQLMARYPDRFQVPEQIRRVEIEQQRKAG